MANFSDIHNGRSYIFDIVFIMRVHLGFRHA